jgi:hypothetical protein
MHSRVHVELVTKDNSEQKTATSELVINRTSVADSGMYQCRANNSAGFNQLTTWLDVKSTDVTLSPVINLRAVPVSSSSIWVTWDDPPENRNLNLVAYAVHYQPIGVDKVKEMQKVVLVNEETLVKLRPYMNYTIYVTVFANNGYSEPSQAVVAATTKEDLQSSMSTILSTTHRASVASYSSLENPQDSDILFSDSATYSSNSNRLTDQQLGIIIGSCIGFTCIAISTLIVILRGRCSVYSRHVSTHSGVAAGAAGHVANGSVSQTHTAICLCHHHHQMAPLPAFHAPSPTDEQDHCSTAPLYSMSRQHVENEHCDTKGGYMSGSLNGKVKATTNGHQRTIELLSAAADNTMHTAEHQHLEHTLSDDPSQVPLLGQMSSVEGGEETNNTVGTTAALPVSQRRHYVDDLDDIDYDDDHTAAAAAAEDRLRQVAPPRDCCVDVCDADADYSENDPCDAVEQ